MDAAGEYLRVISQMAVGVDNIDLGAATARGIPVGHTPGVLTETTADFAFALLLAAARRVVEGERYVRAGRWKTWGPTLLMGYDLHGATLGILGFGRIGQALAKRASGFDMRILFYDPNADGDAGRSFGAEKHTLDYVLTKADFVSLHVPLTSETHHLIGQRELGKMKPTAVLVNTSRGPTVDPQALYQALNHGEIAFAALDVTDPEPILPGRPTLKLENCLIVPHIASSSVQTRTKMASDGSRQPGGRFERTAPAPLRQSRGLSQVKAAAGFRSLFDVPQCLSRQLGPHSLSALSRFFILRLTFCVALYTLSVPRLYVVPSRFYVPHLHSLAGSAPAVLIEYSL